MCGVFYNFPRLESCHNNNNIFTGPGDFRKCRKNKNHSTVSEEPRVILGDVEAFRGADGDVKSLTAFSILSIDRVLSFSVVGF